MQRNSREMLSLIQQKREKMFESAEIYGLAGTITIQCSQELDKLIYEYQCLLKDEVKQKKPAKVTRKQVMLVWPKKMICV